MKEEKLQDEGDLQIKYLSRRGSVADRDNRVSDLDEHLVVGAVGRSTLVLLLQYRPVL